MADSIQFEIDFGPLEEFINDGAVTEVMVNGPHDVYVEREGKLEKVALSFESNDHLMRVIERFLSPLGARLDES
jgi:pilus assembly protein CpaF